MEIYKQVKMYDSKYKHTAEKLIFSIEISRTGPGWDKPGGNFKGAPKKAIIKINNISMQYLWNSKLMQKNPRWTKHHISEWIWNKEGLRRTHKDQLQQKRINNTNPVFILNIDILFIMDAFVSTLSF